MAGSATATLQGFVTPAFNLPFMEHTHVESSCGSRWGCFGGDTGGVSIASGMGDSTVADCLSYPQWLPAVYAGLYYLITGVCHQAANRVLYPAGVTVSRAKWYVPSHNAFGAHGLGAWTQRDLCIGPNSTQASVMAFRTDETIAKPYGLTRSDNPMSDYDRVAIATADGRADEIEELSALYEERVKRRLPGKVIRQLYTIQRELRGRQGDLAERLNRNEISREEYLNEFTAALRLAAENNRRVLGDKDFAMAYGEAGDFPEGFIDRPLFLSGSNQAA